MLAPAITNALTIDVEDYFQVSAFAPYIRRDEWDRRECRIERNVGRILHLLDERDVKATFFTLGWVAERYPQLVQVHRRPGHELASHGYGHERASDLDRGAFHHDVTHAKKLLEDLSGTPVSGYRAPSFSIGAGNLWAFDVLAQAGYRYSSSIYPLRHDHYGMPDSPRFAYRVGQRCHAGGPGDHAARDEPQPAFQRRWLLPAAALFLSRWMIGRVNREDREAAVFYFHPWEIDVGQPRVAGIDAKTRFRHYVNIPRMDGRLQSLLADFRWGRMDQTSSWPRAGAGVRNF
jgi:polysaccharide deacetylase family protein (PEP-CTERM system associated)